MTAKQLSYHTTPIFEEYEYDAAILHVGINDLLRFDRNSTTLTSVCDDVINAGLRCRNFNIGKTFISSVAFCSKVAADKLRKLNSFMYQACEQHGLTFIDNGPVKHNNSWFLSIGKW